MTAQHHLVAYLATLFALVVVFSIAIIAGAITPGVLGKIEVFGLGTITGGLIGVLRLPSMRSGATVAHVENTTVNEGGPP